MVLISQRGNSELGRIRLSAVAKILAYEQNFMVKKIRLTHVKESALGTQSLPAVESCHPSTQSPEGYMQP